MTPRVDLVPVRWLLPYFRGSRKFWIVAAVATLVSSALEPLVPALLKPLLDEGFTGGGFSLWLVPAALLLLFAVRGIAGFLADLALARITQDGLVRLREAMFARLLDARLGLFSRENATSLSNTVVFEVQNGTQLLVNSVIALLKDTLALLALMGYLLYLNWQLTLVVLAVVPAVGWIVRTLSRRLYRIARSAQTAVNDLAYVVEENVLAARVVRLHGAQASQAGRFERLSMALRRLALKSAAASAAITPMTHMLAAAALSVVICMALWQSREGITVGTFASFITAMLMLIAPIKRLSEAASPISRGLAAVQRAVDLVEKAPAESGGSHAPGRAQGRINLRGVTVRYRDDAPPALDHVSLDIAPGQSVALVGPSGSGKTTLANLLPRFVTPTEGEVLLDGVDVAQWRLDALRAQFALVSQDVVMFNDTLAANIALESPPDAARLERCIDAANLRSLVESLPQGLDTVTGHNATELSGGQRQRLAIARALYKDAPILILDEATSALDAASERLVQEALQRLMAGRTTLVIAHRLSTIEHADRVVVLDQGRPVESGTHAELLALGGLYARLHASHGGADGAEETAP
ncbi:lipid A export permease/ATP-binding protein MsbA [Ramlibacter sp.]|uniref:lipid A export permease/ATP-binding protein MsbA n=1 Tax=Ramlibacter sp. TaxID=1917967 RepID=UPI002D4DE4A8|nr:lipid A export permease/ATP-binding protein MsbA [Ramlibacter sp.]HYD75505.1 lipid A export permease/ATP-binding protein MsbA [Ramlibacter sp.]